MTPERAAAHYRKYGRPDQRRRRKAGICLSCSTPITERNPRTGQLFWRCPTHRAQSTHASRTYIRAMHATRRAHGLCRDCGCESDRRPGTQERYARCRACRIITARYQAESRQRRKAAAAGARP